LCPLGPSVNLSPSGSVRRADPLSANRTRNRSHRRKHEMHRFLTALGTIALLATAPAFAESAVVKVGHNRLEPAELTVEAGSTVIFRNEDAMPGGHTIVAEDGSFESPGLAKDEEWSHTFDAPGAYPYAIKQHPSAKGTITVK
jgi:plastocyanin